MQIVALADREPFITADGSGIRELAHPSWTGARHQSLAEATVEPGGETAEHYHPQSSTGAAVLLRPRLRARGHGADRWC